MSITMGAITQLAVTDTTAQLSVPAATGGTGPYAYQWYKSTTSGFSPGGGNIIAGATSLTLNDSGLIPGTKYYYEVVGTDTGHSNDTANTSQLPVVTAAPAQSQNAFSQASQLGMLDQYFDYNTVPVMVDVSQATPLFAGCAVKIVDSAGGIPKVVACSANSDEVFGFVNYDQKSISFAAGQTCEISQAGNVLYLYATGAIARGVQVSLDLTTNGGVRAASGHTGDDIVGWAFDKAVAAGALFRVRVSVPSFAKV